MRRIQRVVGTQLFVSDAALELRDFRRIRLSLKSVGEFLRCAKDRYKGQSRSRCAVP